MSDIRSTYRITEEYSRVAIAALFALVTVAIVGTVFLSPSMVVAVVLGVFAVFVSFARPTWSLTFLLAYLPFESFLLKWISDEIYVYARYFSEVLIYLLAAAVLWRLITGSIKLKSTPIDIAFVLFIVALLATTIINLVAPVYAILGIRQIIRFMILFFVVVYLAPQKQWIKITLGILFAILAIQVMLGFSQALFGESIDSFLLPSEARTYGEIQLTAGTTQFWDPGQRVFGTLGRYDRLGTFMAFFMLLLTALLYEPKWKDYRTQLSILLVLALPALALTYSRSAWFGFVLGFFFISVWAMRDRRVIVATSLAVGSIALYLAFTGLVVNRLIDVSDQSISERFFEAFSYARWQGEYSGFGRVYWMLLTPLEVIPASPIFGHGPATFGGGAVAALGNSEVYDELGLPFGVYGTEGYIDNNWFSLWGETGTLGFGLYLWIYIALFLTCIRVWRKSKDPLTRALAIGTAATMISIAFNALLGTNLEVRTLASYLWVFPAIVIVQADRENLL